METRASRRRPRRPSRTLVFASDRPGDRPSLAAALDDLAHLLSANSNSARNDFNKRLQSISHDLSLQPGESSPVPAGLRLATTAVLDDLGKCGDLKIAPIRKAALHIVSLLPPEVGAMRFLARATSCCCDDAAGVDVSSLDFAFSALARILREVDSSSKAGGNPRTESETSGDGVCLRAEVNDAVSVMADTFRIALFLRAHLWRRDMSDRDLSDETLYSSSARSGADSDSSLRKRRPSLNRCERACPATALRGAAIDALSAVATVSPLALVPYWNTLLPEQAGVVESSRGVKRSETLANVMLYERNEEVRGNAVSLVTKLLVGTSRFIRGAVSVSSPSKSSALASSAFKTTGSRVVRTYSALYSLTTSAISVEKSAGVLARLMRLASELCSNAHLPAVPRDRVTTLIFALHQRILPSANTDLTSTTAALSCLATCLTVNADALALEDDMDLFDLFLTILELLRSSRSSTPEALSVLQALASCDSSMVGTNFATLVPLLQNISNRADDDRVLRLHVLRCVRSLVVALLQPESKESSGTRRLSEKIHSIWTDFVEPAWSDSFHVMRSCSLEIIDILLRGSVDCRDLHDLLLPMVHAAGMALSRDDSSSVRAAAVKALNSTPLLLVAESSRCFAYAKLVVAMEGDSSLSVRSKCVLAAGNLVSQVSAWTFQAANPALDEFLVLLQAQCHAALKCLEEPIPGPEVAGRQRADIEAMRASSVWSIESCTVQVLRRKVDLAPGDSSLLWMLEFFARSSALVRDMAASDAEFAKVRWNACRVLGKLHCLTDAKDERLAIRSTLCTPLASRTCNSKVRLAAVKGLQAIVSSSSFKDGGVAVTLLLCTLSPEARDASAPLGDALRDVSYLEAWSSLVCDLLCLLKDDSLTVPMTGHNCDVLLDAACRRAALPEYALRLLTTPVALETGGTHVCGSAAEEYKAALDAWVSLPETVQLAITRASRMAERCADGSPGREKLIKAGQILAGRSSEGTSSYFS
jgi:hypothetical protein